MSIFPTSRKIGATRRPDIRHSANLSLTQLRGTGFSGAEVSHANFQYADLSGSNISQSQANSAKGNVRTILPHGMSPPAHWS